MNYILLILYKINTQQYLLGNGSTVFFAYFLTPILVSSIAHSYGWGAVWAVVAILTFASLLCFISLPKKKRTSNSIG